MAYSLHIFKLCVLLLMPCEMAFRLRANQCFLVNILLLENEFK